MSESINDDNELALVGERLAELRETLTQTTGVSWSQDKLAKELKMSKNTIFRLERGLGAIDKLIKVILFYHSKGFNIEWIFLPNNSNINKFRQISQNDSVVDPKEDLILAYERLGKLIYGK